MNHDADHEHLLADALADSAPAGFREALLHRTLRLARRRRRFRQTRHAAAVLVALCAVAALIWSTTRPHQSAPGRPSAGYELVRTQPLPARAMVTTQPLAAAWLVSSVATRRVVHTSDGIREITDDELLALIASRPAVLIRSGPDSERLVFSNPEDAEGFPVN